MDIADTCDRRRFLIRRWSVLLFTLAMVALHAGSPARAAMLGLPLVTAGLAVQWFRQPVLERWLASGRLIIADTFIVTLAFLGARLSTPALVAYGGIVLLGVRVGDRRRFAPAGVALVVIVAAVAAAGLATGFSLTASDALYLPLLGAAAMHFGDLGQRIVTGAASERVRPRPDSNEWWALLQISETIGSGLELGQVMRTIVHRVGELVTTDSCSILLAEGTDRTGFVVASMGHPEVDMLQLDLDNYPEIRAALTTRETVVIDDVEDSVLIAPARAVLRSKGYCSLLVLPLNFRDDVLGALVIRSRRAFTPAEVSFCKVVAGASATALKNALLYQDVRAEVARHRETGETLRRVLDCTPDLIAATDLDGKVVEFNRGAEILTGLHVDRARDRNLREILGGTLEIPALGASGTEPQDVAFHGAQGEAVELGLISAPLSDADGKQVGRVWIGRDVTKLRRVEKRLVQAERLSSLGEIVAGVAHELNNPLSGVVGYAELLRMRSQDPEQLRDLDRIVDSSLRCQKIVYNLLSFARKHPPEKKYQSLNTCVEKVLDLKSYHLRSSKIEAVLELDPDLPRTSFDFQQLEQVILNLLNNAEHAITSIRRPGRIVLRTGVAGESVYVEVEDDGPGVPAAVRDRIFNPFFTTKGIGDGTGLGLSVSYGLVQEHGGAIELVQETEAGARFRVSLPLVEGEPERDEQPWPARDDVKPLAGRHVLVAEDEPMVLELFGQLLGEEGATVDLARDGREAWEKLSSRDYDLIVADLRMPNLDGRQLYELAAEERPEMIRRFVFATGDLMREDAVEFLSALPNRILCKPLELETVRRVLGQAIEANAPKG